MRILLPIICLSLAACGSGPQFQPSAAAATGDDATQQVVRKNERTGTIFILSAKPFSSVAVMQASDPSVTQFGTSFHVKVTNDGADAASFSLDSVSVQQGGKSLQVIGAEAAKRTVARNNQTTQAIGMATILLGGLSSTLGSAGTSVASALSTASTQISMQVMQTVMTTSANDARAFEDQASMTFVSSARIPPGNQVKGVFAVADVQSGKPLQIEIVVGDDVHRFSFVPQ